MCGIIGFSGYIDAEKVVLEGLKELEYRGYDSAGIALQREDSDIPYIVKKTGPVKELEKAVLENRVESFCGIGHTRWATHGGVTDVNAHPHHIGKVVLIHNGIIENYQELINSYELKDKLISETDSEVACHILNYYYEKTKDPFESIKRTVGVIIGSYSFCIMFSDIKDTIFSIRNVSPLVAASCDKGSFIASDVTALIQYSKKYFVLPEKVIAEIKKTGIELRSPDGKKVEPDYLTVDWDVEAAQKAGYPHFMIKEINEQPDALERTVRPRIVSGMTDFSGDNIPDSLFTDCSRIIIIACGTANYAGTVGKSIFEPLLKIPVNVYIASEYRYEDVITDKNTLCIVISQSGETVDTLEAMKLASQKGAKTLAIVNVKASTIAREADYVLYTHAGPEISVASTKAYTVQLAALYLLAAKMGELRGCLTNDEASEFTKAIENISDTVKKVLEYVPAQCKHVSETMIKSKDAFYIGRGLDYAFSLEGALKLKEISYIHAEACAAGELKHGTIALIEKETPVVAIATQKKIFAKTLSNVKEVKARGAFVILISRGDEEIAEETCDILIKIPSMDDRFAVFAVAVILQLIAYYTADGKGFNVDKPRNLAKSVTVE